MTSLATCNRKLETPSMQTESNDATLRHTKVIGDGLQHVMCNNGTDVDNHKAVLMFAKSLKDNSHGLPEAILADLTKLIAGLEKGAQSMSEHQAAINCLQGLGKSDDYVGILTPLFRENALGKLAAQPEKSDVELMQKISAKLQRHVDLKTKLVYSVDQKREFYMDLGLALDTYQSLTEGDKKLTFGPLKRTFHSLVLLASQGVNA